MRTALYYPHTEVRSETLVRDALLTWDRLEYIAPWLSYQPNYGEKKEIAEAMELFGARRVVSNDDHDRVHELIVDLFDTDDMPEMFFQGSSGVEDYEIWPQKLLNSTWQFLEERNFIRKDPNNPDPIASEPGGLAIMALLAEVLAGDTRARVTDRIEAYKCITHLPDRKPQEGERVDNVVPLTFKALSLSDVPLRKLIDYRRREAIEPGGSDLTKLRHSYLSTLEKHALAIAKYSEGSSDRKQLDAEFIEDMKGDCASIRMELGYAKTEAWLSKDFLTLALGGIAAATAAFVPNFPIPEAATASALLLPFAGVLGTTSKLAKARREVLAKHPMAYLYDLKQTL